MVRNCKGIRKCLYAQNNTEHQMRDVLRKACDAAGSQLAWAEANGFSPFFVSDVLGKKRGISDEVLRALKYVKLTPRYQRKD